MINLIFKKIIKKNIRFKDIYKDQECYIIGNGSSLKRYDLNLFSNKKIITCNWMLLHKDFKKLKNVVAYIACSPFWFAPFKKNPYSRKIEYNRSNNIFFRNFKGIEIPLFTSITNIFFLKNINKVLLHDFKLKEINLDYNLLHEKFSLLRGAFYAMLGIASYMGFKKIFLVGLDYWMSDPLMGHFYEKDFSKRKEAAEANYSIKNQKHKEDQDFIDQINQKMDVKMLCPQNYDSNLFESISYQDFFKVKENFKKNNEIVSHDNLSDLSKLNWKYEIF